MSFSPSFLAGIAALLVVEQLTAPLPGSARLWQLLVAALIVPVPALTVWWAGHAARRAERSDRPLSRTWNRWFRWQWLGVPLAYGLVLAAGGLIDLSARLAPGSQALRFVILLAPLVAIEVSFRRAEDRLIRWFEERGRLTSMGAGAFWGRTLLMIVIPLFTFGVALDAISFDRDLEVFFGATAIGTTIALLLGLLGLAVGLPLLLRVAMRTDRRLPAHLAEVLLRTAADLGMRRSAVLVQRSDERVVNALLVGPLPWPRYLILSDGILAELDPFALRGVIAHEVGHARAAHPAWLLLACGVIPILALQPATLVPIDGWSEVELSIAAIVGLASGWLTIRALLIRFEYEADHLSSQAMGGAEPTIHALRQTESLGPRTKVRWWMRRHPTDRQRVQSMQRLELDPVARARFQRRGRWLRVGLLASAGLVLTVSVAAHLRRLPGDLAVFRLYTGDFHGAHAAITDAEASAPAAEREFLERLAEEARAAEELIGPGGSWAELRAELGRRAWQRGVQVAAVDGPRAARPYLSLALSAGPDEPVLRTTWMWAEAVAADDEDRADQLVQHLLAFTGLPPELRGAAEHAARHRRTPISNG